MLNDRMGRWLCMIGTVLASACGSQPAAPVLENHREASLFPGASTDCTRDGWCRFAEDPPIRASAIYVDATAVYVVGYQGETDEDRDSAAIARWDGGRWKVWNLAGVALFSIAGYGPHIWASGRKAPVFELVNDSWRADETFTDATEIAVGPSDVLLAINGNILRHTGPAAWETVFTRASTSIHDWSVYNLSADNSGRAWAVVSQLYGSVQLFSRQPDAPSFEPADTPRDLYRVSARSATDVAVIGRAGLRRWDGAAWHDLAFAPDIGFSALVHRGTDLVVLGAIDPTTAGVAVVGARGTSFAPLPDDPDALAVGPDGSLWACSSRHNHLWFHAP